MRLDIAVELCGDVVAQPLGIHFEIEIAQRVDTRAARFGHLVARDGDEAVDVNVVRRLVAGVLEHGWPEQGVEVDDVLADEVDHLRVGRGQEFLEAACLTIFLCLARIEIILQRGKIADRRVEPDIEVFSGQIGDRDAEVGRVARDVPVAERLVAFGVQPLPRLVDDLRLQPAGLLQPLAQEGHALLVRELEEKVIGRAQLGLRARERRVRIDQLSG
jgi:hypothetical protein